MRRKLEQARLAAGLTQAQVGALIGKTQSHYGKVERGMIGLSADEALILTEKLNISLADLVEIKGKTDQPIAWEVYSTDPLVRIGEVMVRNQPEAIRKAQEKWPMEADANRPQYGFHVRKKT